MSSIMFGGEEKPRAPAAPPAEKKAERGRGGGGTQSTPSRRTGLFEQVSGGRNLCCMLCCDKYTCVRREARLERVAQLAQDDALLVTAQLRHSATIRRTRSARGGNPHKRGVRRARGERHSHYTHSHIYKEADAVRYCARPPKLP